MQVENIIFLLNHSHKNNLGKTVLHAVLQHLKSFMERGWEILSTKNKKNKD